MKIGLVGLGGWARDAYLPLLAEMTEIRVEAVAARTEATRQFAKKTFGSGLAVFADYKDLLKVETLDALLIALPNSQHAEALEAAAASNKHILFEPPVATDNETAKRILDALAKSGCGIQADLELRYLPVMKAVSAKLQSGVLGKPLMAKIRLWCDWGNKGGDWGKKIVGQSFFSWIGPWYLDVLDCVFGATAEEAFVVGGYNRNGKLMDYGWASLVYSGGQIGQWEFSLVSPQDTVIELLVACDRGEIEVDLITGGWRWRHVDEIWKEELSPASVPVFGFVGMREALHGFFDAISNGCIPRANIDVIRRVHCAVQLCSDAE